MTIFSWTIIRNMDSPETLDDQKFHVKLLETHIKNGSSTILLMDRHTYILYPFLHVCVAFQHTSRYCRNLPVWSLTVIFSNTDIYSPVPEVDI